MNDNRKSISYVLKYASGVLRSAFDRGSESAETAFSEQSEDSPPGLFHSAVFALAAFVPQLILLFINLRYYTIVSGEGSPSQLHLIHLTALAEAVLLFLSASVSILCLMRRSSVHFIIVLLSIILPVIYLWIFCSYFDAFWPWIPAWIASSDHLVFYQFAFMMPSILYGLIRISAVRLSRVHRKQGIILAVSLVAMPLIWYCIARFSLFSGLYRQTAVSQKVITAFVSVFCILTTAVLLFALFRLLIILYRLTFRSGKQVRIVIYAVVGIVLPIAGLLLNRAIDFPADYQHPVFYVLAVLNGVFLSMPETRNCRMNRILFAGRAFFFSFTLYFFVSFLPFLPLAIPAMLAAGAGFLILTPFLLFIVHIHVLGGDFRRQIAQKGKRFVYALTAACVLALPLSLSSIAVYDRILLHQAIDYLYEPDYVKDSSFRGNRTALKNVLYRQEKMKMGSQLPFIDAAYSWIVFDNLVLPSAKADYIHKAFFGTPVGEVKQSSGGVAGYFFSGPRSPHVKDAAAIAKETDSSETVLDAVSVTSAVENGCVKSSAVLTMKNNGSFQNEFRADISVSDGVLVKDFWLKIGDEKVPGRIFEKKTALWVYEAIRTTRRDPGIIFYKGYNELLLKVFPFAPQEIRTAGFDFIYPETASPVVTIAGRKIDLKKGSGSGIISVSGEQSSSVFVPAAEKKNLPKILRRPRIVLIADRSIDKVSSAEIKNAAALSLKEFPSAERTVLYAANAGCSSASDSIDAINTLTDQVLDRRFPAQGSFCSDRAIRHILLTLKGGDDWFPLPILVTKGGRSLKEENGSWFASLLPDAPFYGISDGMILRFENFSGQKISSSVLPVRKGFAGNVPVYLSGKDDDSFSVVPANGNNLSSAGMLVNGLAASADYTAMVWNPSLTQKLRAGLLKRGRSSGILNGAVSGIVVENSSQWRILEEKEKQKMKGKDAFEIAESPEPSIFVLGFLLLFVAGVYTWRRRKRITD